MTIIFAILSFVFGSIVGSFINVVLLRKNTGETMVRGRSRCFSCGATLAWYDNIPVVSYLALGGKCRYCRSRISMQYPIVELSVGLLAIIIALYVIVNVKHSVFDIEIFIKFLFYFAVFAALFTLAAYDARTKIIDGHLLRIFAMGAAFAALLRWYLIAWQLRTVAFDIGAACLIWLFFWAMCHFSHEQWMGRGDGAVALWCAILLGFPLSVAMLLFSFWIGAAYGIYFIVLQWMRARGDMRRTLAMQIPFAPFLAVGTLAVWYFAESIAIFFVLYQ